MIAHCEAGGGGAVARIGSCRDITAPARDAGLALASLADGVLASRFCAWRGASDKRYVASVYIVDREAPDAGLPAFEGFVLIVVARGPLGRRILSVSAIERAGDRIAAIALVLAQGAHEWHVHVLAETGGERRAMVADLRERHCDTAGMRCA